MGEVNLDYQGMYFYIDYEGVKCLSYAGNLKDRIIYVVKDRGNYISYDISYDNGSYILPLYNQWWVVNDK